MVRKSAQYGPEGKAAGDAARDGRVRPRRKGRPSPARTRGGGGAGQRSEAAEKVTRTLSQSHCTKRDLPAEIFSSNKIPNMQWMDRSLKEAYELHILLVWYLCHVSGVTFLHFIVQMNEQCQN